MDLAAMTAHKIAKEYKAAYVNHQSLIQARADSATLMSSAAYMKQLQAAFAVAKEAP